jgi:hypothetical protein
MREEKWMNNNQATLQKMERMGMWGMMRSFRTSMEAGAKADFTPDVQRQLFFPSTTIRIPVSKGGPWIPPASRKRVYGDPRGWFLTG